MARLAIAVPAALGGRLAGLYLHGSLVAGDFDPSRSDLDLLAVLHDEPDDGVLAALRPVLDLVGAEQPTWRGRVEIEVVGRPTVAAVAASQVDGEAVDEALAERLLARVSPGEALHLLPATGHRVLTWATVHAGGVALAGPPASELLPVFGEEQQRAALLQHVRDWPQWARGMDGVGGQAYTVLSVCRAHVRLREGEQVSKREAARRAASALPPWAPLVRWAGEWWYGGGADDAATRHPEVVAFVDEVCAGLLRDCVPDPLT